MKITRFPSVSVAVAIAALSLFARAYAQEPRLNNLSTRGQAGTGDNVLSAGFVIDGTGPDKPVLIRAVGPGLSQFGLTGVLADPILTLYNSAGVAIATNDNWIAANAATFTSVGAFAFPANSKDSAIVMSLPPGLYSAQVRGVGTTTGLASVEVYEVGSPGTKLHNLSTRALVGTGANVMIPGIVLSAGNGARRLLIRAAGPSLAAFGLQNTLVDPTLTVTNSTGTVTYASNNDWASPVDIASADAVNLNTAFIQNGAFTFANGSKDAAVLVSLAPGNYGIQVSGVGGTSGLALVEVYDFTPDTPPVVTVVASKTTADESGNNNGELIFTRSGDTLSALTVSYGTGGSAVNGFDYVLLPNSITFPSGASTVKLPILPNPDLQTEGIDTVVVTIAPAPFYTVGAASSATVTIADSPASLYIATLRPAGGATASTGYGTATILLSGSGTLAGVTVTFSNLSSAEVTAHLTLGTNDDFVANLPQGQVNGVQWRFTPTGVYTSTDLLNALKNGTISVRIDSANYPAGELRGNFIQGTGSQTFTAPPAAPAISLTNASADDAARLLTQATFGPKKSEIDALTGQSLAVWIDTQLAMPTFTSHRAATLADRVAFGGSPSVTNWNAVHAPNRQNAWFKTVLTAPDQLRQRVAFALSQILVVSDVSLGDDSRAEPLANYYDILGNGAFGNFRTLLENVTLSPIMGEYLSSLRNSKANIATGQTPDENYAREIMQLFTIGLNLLQPDGTLVLGTDGLPIPTYNQTTISEMAKVFTGWAYPSTNLNNFRSAGANYISPMQLFPAFHEDAVKNISPVSATSIAANQGGTKDLQLALDALFNHQNTGPFISRQLIQRLVTSNPSPAYVYRVAQKFANDGTGVRGNLGAVVRAILTDYEARSPAVAANLSFGKLKEPLLRLTGLLRTFNATSRIGRYAGYQNTVDGVPITGTTPNPGLSEQARTASNSTATNITGTQNALAEAALRSPTVFNFYLPAYVVPGPLASAGLFAPEFQITDDTYAITVPNFLRGFVLANNTATTVAGNATLVLDLSYEMTLVSNPSALVDHLGRVLTGGALPAAMRTRVTTALSALPASATALDRAQSAVLVIATSPAAATQK